MVHRISLTLVKAFTTKFTFYGAINNDRVLWIIAHTQYIGYKT